MKRLFLLRHAQSPGSSSGDESRTLSPKGKEDAHALGKYMQSKGYIPDYVLCSPALRTKQTLEGVQHHLGVDAVDYPDILYSGSTEDYFSKLQGVSNDYAAVLMVAHNPSIYELALRLGSPASDSIAQRLSEGYSPASLSVLDCPCEAWADLQLGENALVHLVDPMDYNAPARPTRWM